MPIFFLKAQDLAFRLVTDLHIGGDRRRARPDRDVLTLFHDIHQRIVRPFDGRLKRPDVIVVAAFCDVRDDLVDDPAKFFVVRNLRQALDGNTSFNLVSSFYLPPFGWGKVGFRFLRDIIKTPL